MFTRLTNGLLTSKRRSSLGDHLRTLGSDGAHLLEQFSILEEPVIIALALQHEGAAQMAHGGSG